MGKPSASHTFTSGKGNVLADTFLAQLQGTRIPGMNRRKPGAGILLHGNPFFAQPLRDPLKDQILDASAFAGGTNLPFAISRVRDAGCGQQGDRLPYLWL